jgi:PAS domain S-box-containing protein
MPVASELVALFTALPTPHLLLSPELVIEAASDAYLAATLTRREQLVGQYMFDVFPDNPLTPEANGLHNVRASLQQVLATGQLQRIAQQHYDVPDPEHPGQFVERYWQALNAPVLDAQGKVTHIIHSAVDVTAEVQAQAQLRESQADEQTARAEVEQQRQRFLEVLTQMPAYIAVYQGPDHIYQFVNPAYQSLFPHRSFLGRPFREGTPEAEGLGVVALFNQVYQTGEPVYLREMEGWFDFHGNGQPVQVFLNISLHPLRNVQGDIDGVLDFTYDVSEQVRARQQVEQLNQELETRVQERTAALQAAQIDADAQRVRLESVLQHAPAAIAVYDGPEFVLELVNPVYQALLPGRPLVGKPVRQAFPEMAELPVYQTLRRVYETGLPHEERDQLITIPGVDGQLEDRYFNFTLQARHDAQARINGVIGIAFEVTEQVLARRLAETLQAELLATAQHQAHERESFQQVFEQTPALIALLRAPEHRFEYANPAYQAIFPGRQLVGLNAAEAAPELVAQGFVHLLDRVYQTGETYFGSEQPFAPPSAEGLPPHTHYFNFTYQAYREAGHIAGVSIFAFDVTQQVLARQQREAERQELAQLFMQAPAPIVILDGPDLVFQLVNPAYQRIFPGRALAGKPLLEALPELVGTPIPALFYGVYQTGEPVTVHEMPLQMARHQDHPPEEIYWTFTYQARRDVHGAIDGVRVFAHDVTEQVQARQTTEASAQQLRLLTDALPALIGYLDRDHIYRFANRAYQDWFGQEPAALIGRPVREVVGEAAYQAALPRMEQALAGERVDFDARMPYRTDFTRYIHTSYVPDVQAGEVAGFYTLVLDVTEQVLAREQVLDLNQELAAINEELTATNEELHESNSRLTRTNADLDTFVYAASHDLKAPIANIEGLLDVLRDYLPTGDQEPMVPRLVDMMQGAIRRFQQTVGHLTDVARLQYDAESMANDVDVPGLLDDVRLDLWPLLDSTQAQLRTAVEVCPNVRLPAKNMRSILFNLLSNALKYRAPDRLPVVQVRTQCMATQFVLQVQDNGLGLSEAQQQKLFTMFRRLHTHVEGSGVGLYLIKRMIELAGGTITVHSQPDVGSTFTVTLPRVARG